MKVEIENFTDRMRCLLLLLFLSSLLLLFHYFGLTNSLYWTISWFDILQHSLGGFILGLICALSIKKKYWPLYILFILSVLIGWEAFELFIVKIPIFSTNIYILDTFVDMFLGGFFAFLGIRFAFR